MGSGDVGSASGSGIDAASSGSSAGAGSTGGSTGASSGVDASTDGSSGLGGATGGADANGLDGQGDDGNASDCPSGQVCCGWLSSNGYPSAACVSGCVGEDGEEAVQFCDLNAPVCPPSKMCRPALFLRGYGACE